MHCRTDWKVYLYLSQMQQLIFFKKNSKMSMARKRVFVSICNIVLIITLDHLQIFICVIFYFFNAFFTFFFLWLFNIFFYFKFRYSSCNRKFSTNNNVILDLQNKIWKMNSNVFAFKQVADEFPYL